MKERWSLEARMTLHYLFNILGYTRKDADWFDLYKALHGTSRKIETVYEDWKYSHGIKRGGMWRDQILIPIERYNDTQRTAFDQARADLEECAARLGITLRVQQGAPTAQTVAVPSTDITAATVATSTLHATSSPFSTVALGSNTSNVQGRERTKQSNKRKAPASTFTSHPSPPAKGQERKSQKVSTRPSKRQKAVTSYTASDDDAAREPEDDGSAPRYGVKTQANIDDSDSDCIIIGSNTRAGVLRSRIEAEDGKQPQKTESQQKTPALRESLTVTAAQSQKSGPDEDFVMDDISQEDSAEEIIGKQSSSLQDARNNDNGKGSHPPELHGAEPKRASAGNNAIQLDDAADSNQRPSGPHPAPPPWVRGEVSLADRPGYAAWRWTHLDDILLEAHQNRYPSVHDPRTKQPEDPEELGSFDRTLNFFEHMFGGHRDEIRQVILSDKTSNLYPGETLRSVYRTLRYTLGLNCKYRLSKVFSSPATCFPNFLLASEAYACEIEMLHRSDVDFTGAGGAVVVVCGDRGRNRVEGSGLGEDTLTANEVHFVHHDNPIFKRGGRVYHVEVHQPKLAILGNDRAFNTASVTIDAMLCDAQACHKCSTADSLDTSATSGFPRVHHRHIGPEDRFLQRDPHLYASHNEDTGHEFPAEAPAFPQVVQFWDGCVQGVITCIGGNCHVCFESRLDHYKDDPSFLTMEEYRAKLKQEKLKQEMLALAEAEAKKVQKADKAKKVADERKKKADKRREAAAERRRNANKLTEEDKAARETNDDEAPGSPLRRL